MDKKKLTVDDIGSIEKITVEMTYRSWDGTAGAGAISVICGEGAGDPIFNKLLRAFETYVKERDQKEAADTIEAERAEYERLKKKFERKDNGKNPTK